MAGNALDETNDAGCHSGACRDLYNGDAAQSGKSVPMFRGV